MNRHKINQWSCFRAIALVVLVLPVLLGTVPGLHHHPSSACDTDQPAARGMVDGGNDCPFCALSRVPLQVVTADVGDSPSLDPAARPVQGPGSPAQKLPASDCPPRAPPVHDSTWTL